MMNILRSMLLPLALLVAAGCTSPAARIRQNPAVFAGFPPEIQAQVRQGHIASGFSPAAVRMALGDPDRVYHRSTIHGTNEIWAYTSFEVHTLPQNTTAVSSFAEPLSNASYVPGIVLVDVQKRDTYEALRIEFEGQQVKAIETLKK